MRHNPTQSASGGGPADASHASLSLPAWTYTDPDFLALERRHVFLPSWQLVCHESDIPNAGDYQTFTMLGESAFVVRGRDSAIRAFHNVCRHRAARLLDGGAGHCGRQIICPYHAWTYQLDGALTGVPYSEEYESFDRRDFGLKAIECERFAGFVFIRFQSGGPSLKEYMAPLAEELALYRTKDMAPLRTTGARSRAVNWKNATDNYVDALHIRVAHNGLHDLLGETYRLSIDRGVVKIFSEAGARSPQTLSNRAYCRFLPEVAHLPPERRRLWTYYRLWPNLMFDVYPDQIDFMQFIPVTATTCLLRENAYALADDRREMRAARYLNWRINRIVNREDTDLIERVQAGMQSSSFAQGPLGRNEICLRHFAEQMRAAIPAAACPAKPENATIEASLRR